MSGQTIDVVSSAGIWTSVTGGTNVNPPGLGTNTVSWGIPATTGGGQSGYVYNQAGLPAFSVAPETIFLIGQFTHNNFPIQAGTSITAATLDVSVDMTIPADGLGTANVFKTFTYNFDHWETPNGDNPCANGGPNNAGVNVNGCADRVSIGVTPNQVFTINDVMYTLQLGFSNDGGLTLVNEFWTAENQANSASLYGRFTTNVIPEPGFYGLLGIGLAGLYTVARRRKQA